jgi:NAD(P)-dependent dehydrogenase (short-subunit alcohol dehydrogenase family)
MEEMRGNTAVVTGAGGNLGYALTNRLLQSGARVVVVEHRRERLEEIFGPAESQPNLYYLQANLTEWAEVQRLAEEAIAWAGRIHLLANIAGGFKMGKRYTKRS